MIPFQFDRPDSIQRATKELSSDGAMALAGGTTLLDLMKLNVLTPTRLSYIKAILQREIATQDLKLVVGAGCTMSQLADDAAVKTKLPAVRQSLILAASPQIRNMATIGGNLLQRTRSAYFRHPDMPLPEDVETKSPSSFEGIDTSLLAVLGNGGRLVGMYPGDFAVTLVAFDGSIDLVGPDGPRTVQAREFYQRPSDGAFQYTTSLKKGELITAIGIPISAALQHSIYFKVRERSSYAFALASASIGLELSGSGTSARIAAARVGLGGLGSIPWHSSEAEKILVGKTASDETFQQAAEAALASADPPAGLEYKVVLARRVIVRALQILRDQGPLNDEQVWAMQHGRGDQ